MKGEKETHRPHHISIPPKDAIAIVPPKKVRTCSRPAINPKTPPLHLHLHFYILYIHLCTLPKAQS